MNKALFLSIGLALCAGTVNYNFAKENDTISKLRNIIKHWPGETINSLGYLPSHLKNFANVQSFAVSLAAHASALAFSRVRALAFGVKGARTVFKTVIATLGLGATVSGGSIAIELVTT